MTDDDEQETKRRCWLGDPASNGLIRVLAAMQASDLRTRTGAAAAAASSSNSERVKSETQYQQDPKDLLAHTHTLSSVFAYLPTGSSESPSLPQMIVAVVLCMEIALVLGVGFLLLLSGSVAGTVMRSLMQHGGGFGTKGAHAAAGAVSASVFLWGVLGFMSWFFQASRAVLLQELGLRKPSGVSCRFIAAFVAIEGLLVFSIAWLEGFSSSSSNNNQSSSSRSPIFSWENVLVSTTASSRSDTFPATLQLETLVLAPLKEELFFRGLVFLVVWNRLQASPSSSSSITKSALVTNALFAAVHLANMRKLGSEYSASYVLYQVGFAWLVGVFLSLRFAVSQSLLECFLLHFVNNVLAMAVSKQLAVAFTDPVTLASVLSSVSLYLGGIQYSHRQLSRHPLARSDRAKAT